MVIRTVRLGQTLDAGQAEQAGRMLDAGHGRAGPADSRGRSREHSSIPQAPSVQAYIPDAQPARWGASTALGTAGARLTACLGALLAAGVLACAPTGTDADKLPPDIPDPATVQTEAGALAYYHRVLTLLPTPFDRFVAETGIFTDELAGLPGITGAGGTYTALDSRLTATLPSAPFGGVDGYLGSYAKWHRLRGQVREARGFLASYALAPDSTDVYNEQDLRAHLYALEGYAEIFLADLYCSGIPLSTVDFQGDYTLTPGFKTEDVYRHAAGLFDSALALVHDSASTGALAAVGKGRALLGAGEWAAAAAAVTAVPDGYQYLVIDNGPSPGYGEGRLLQGFAGSYASIVNNSGALNTPGMGDGEGLNGLPYVSSQDPRTPATALGPGPQGGTYYFPATYPRSGPVTLVLASAVEARLIQAEAALRAGSGEWLTILNALRTDGTFDTQPTPDPNDDPTATDTLWHAGTGGVAGLAPLADPAPGSSGASRARVDLVFRERAFWLYLTGHRQGDLRRLLRQYPGLGYAPALVYPVGTYPGGSGLYGEVLVAPVPETEREGNSQYTGCIHLGA